MGSGSGKKPQKSWTSNEVASAAELWGNGATIPAISEALGRNQPGVRHMIRRNRQMFPRRRIPWGTQGPVGLTIHITPFAQKTLDFHAAKAKVSTNRFIQLLILDAVAREETMLRIVDAAERRAIV